jgi:tetratricopeptide (TPR) repeat protein
MSTTFSIKRIGVVLQQADLVSSTQVELALQEQTKFEKMRLGEILARRGWIERETVDFFAEEWPTLLSQKAQQPLGQYLKKAALLNDRQVEAILLEQKQTGLKFGELAVKQGWLKRTTIDFFLKNLGLKRESNGDRNGVVESLHESRLSEPVKTIEERLLNNQRCEPIRLLKQYRQILRQSSVPAKKIPEQAELLDMGLIVQQGNSVRISNPIYEKSFDLEWIERELAHLRPFSQIRIKLFKLEKKASSPYSLLEEILWWTGEQFYLTQKLCQMICKSESYIRTGEEALRVKQLVQNNLIQNWETQPAAEPLRIMRQSLLENQQYKPLQLLQVYRQILQHKDVATDKRPEQAELLDLGLLVQQGDNVKVANPIYEQVFHLAWVEKALIRLHPWSDRLQLIKLEEKTNYPYSLLEEILAWTGEQLTLTQKLCQLIHKSNAYIRTGEEALQVKQLVQNNLIQNWETQPAAEPLRIMRQSLLENRRCKPLQLLVLYRQILQHKDVTVDNSPEKAELLALGLIFSLGNRLIVSNPIYEAVFNLNWVTQQIEKKLRDSTSETKENELEKPIPVITHLKTEKKKAVFLPIELSARLILLGLGIAGAIFLGVETYDYLAAKTLFRQGNERLSQGQFEEAIAKYNELLKLDSNYYQAWTNRGYALASLKDYEKMLESCSTATIIEPKAIYAWNCQGEALHNLKRNDEAIAAFDKAIAIDVNNPVFWINKTESLVALKQTNAAIATINRAIALLKQNQQMSSRELSIAFNAQGKAYLQKEAYEKALQAYDRALTYESTYFTAGQGRGIALWKLKRYEEASEQFNELLARPQQTDEQRAETLYYLGLTFNDLNRMAEAIAAFDEALELKPDYQAAQEAKQKISD